jgi:cupin 2 domain-containing protein
MKMINFFEMKQFPPAGEESFELLFQSATFHIERIVSVGHADTEGSWYDQDHDEWVMLARGEAILFIEGEGEVAMKAGDCLFIPAHQRHRVVSTSSEPPCYWLAIHARPSM